MSRPVPRRPSAGDPYGIRPSGSPTAAALSAVGLVVVALITASFMTGKIPSVPGTGDHGGGAVARTPVPSNVVVVNPAVSVRGSIVYAKAGNLWILSGTATHQVTSSGHDAMPAWSPDGQWIYYIQTRTTNGFYPSTEGLSSYRLTYPVLMRVHPDGSGAQQIISGLFTSNGGKYTWFSWYRQPSVSPDGKTLALVSDAPDPSNQDVVLQFLNLTTQKLTMPRIPENPPLGHQDPAWRPDGGAVAFVLNGHDGATGTPVIELYNVKTGAVSALTGPGFTNPSWSPDGRYLAATKTTFYGTDVVILDAATGRVLVQVTTDGLSWAPTWSPAGNELVYLHLAGQTVDLKLVRLEGTAPAWTVKEQPNLTENSGLDGSSRASWYIPPDQLPTPAPTATPSPTPVASGPAVSPSPS